MTENPQERPPMAEAMEWVSRITTVAIMMVAPGLGGYWLDLRLGTNYLVVIGFLVGLPCGIYYLLKMTQALPGVTQKKISGNPKDSESSESERDREDQGL